MITLNFYRNGAYIKGHDVDEICTLVSYAMWACIEDCLKENEDVYHYESAYDDKWKRLGFSYIEINKECSEHVKILKRFKENLTFFVSRWDDIWDENGIKIENCGGRYRRVKVNVIDDCINWDVALADAKKRTRDYLRW